MYLLLRLLDNLLLLGSSRLHNNPVSFAATNSRYQHLNVFFYNYILLIIGFLTLSLHRVLTEYLSNTTGKFHKPRATGFTSLNLTLCFKYSIGAKLCVKRNCSHKNPPNL